MLPRGIVIQHSGQFLTKDINKLKPFEEEKVKQLRKTARGRRSLRPGKLQPSLLRRQLHLKMT